MFHLPLPVMWRCPGKQTWLPNSFKRFYLFLEKREWREKERKRNIDVWLSLVHPPNGDLACNPGMCSNWESNWRPFGS